MNTFWWHNPLSPFSYRTSKTVLEPGVAPSHHEDVSMLQVCILQVGQATIFSPVCLYRGPFFSRCSLLHSGRIFLVSKFAAFGVSSEGADYSQERGHCSAGWGLHSQVSLPLLQPNHQMGWGLHTSNSLSSVISSVSGQISRWGGKWLFFQAWSIVLNWAPVSSKVFTVSPFM